MADRIEPAEPRDDDVIVEPRRDRGGSPWGWIVGILVIIALIVAALLLIPLLTDDEGEVGVGQEDLGVTVGEITENPEEFIGEVVIVSAEVDEVVAPNAFTMGADEGFFGGGEGLLVVSAEDIVLPAGFVRGGDEDDDTLLENDIVQARGVVAEFVIVDAEEELGVDLDDELFEDFEGQPALIATEVAVTPRFAEDEEEIIAEEDEEEVVEAEPEINQIAPINVTDPDDLIDDFETLEGVVVRLQDEIDEVIAPGAFAFGEGENLVLVIGAAPEDPLVEGSEVLVEGPAQTFIFAELEEDIAEAGIEADEEIFEDEGLFEDFEDHPVVFATNMWVLTDLDDVADNPDEFAGLTPTVVGEVEQVISPNAFTINDGEILVVSANVLAEDVIDEASVLVTGVVTEFDIVEIEEETGLAEDELFAGGEDEEAFNVEEAEGISTIIAAEIMVIR